MKTKALIEFLHNVHGRRCVLYGAGPAAHEFMDAVPIEIAYVVDDNPRLHGTSFRGLEVRPPEALGGEAKDGIAVVVGSTAVKAILRNLERFGLHFQSEVFLSPLVLARASEVAHAVLPKLLVTSPSDDGGLFVVDPNNRTAERKLAGNCRGLIREGDGYLLALEHEGLVRLDRNLNETARVALPERLNIHGIALDEDGGHLYVAETARDRIGIYDADDLRRTGVIHVGREQEPVQARHHVNALQMVDGALFACMFSVEGHYRLGIHDDGAVVRFDPDTGQRMDVVVRGLEQPHSILVEEGTIWLCNSMARTVCRGRDPICHLTSYTRGLARHQEYFFIGQSQMRRLSRFQGRFDNISLDCGVTVWDSETKTSRFVPLPVDNVYDILVLAESEA